MSNTTTSTGGGMGLLGWVFIVFLVLKLTGKIDWSWWWVTAPLWIPAVFAVGFLAAVGLVLFIVWLWNSRNAKSRANLKKKKQIRATQNALRNYSRSLRP